MHGHKWVMSTLRLKSFLTIPRANKQYSRNKHLHDFKSGHGALLCPKGIWRQLSCWLLTLYCNHSQVSGLVLVLCPIYIWLVRFFSTASEGLEISQRQDVERAGDIKSSGGLWCILLTGTLWLSDLCHHKTFSLRCAWQRTVLCSPCHLLRIFWEIYLVNILLHGYGL